MARMPARPSTISVLRSSSLLRSIDDEVLQGLVAYSHMASVERGEVIWHTGDLVDFIGLVGTGFVKMVKTTKLGQELTHEIFGPGQMFGFLGAIDGSGCPLSARAVSNLWYLQIPKKSVMPIYERSLPLKDHMMRRTTNRLRMAHEMLARLSTGSVESRIAAVLISLADSYGKETPEGMLIDVPLTRQEIGEMAGTTTESTIRVMSKWQKAGVASSVSKMVTLHDLKVLESTMRV